MKAIKVFKAFAHSAVLFAGTTGAALAQDQLVSGEPYPGFFEGVTIPANGTILTDRVATEAPSNLGKAGPSARTASAWVSWPRTTPRSSSGRLNSNRMAS